MPVNGRLSAWKRGLNAREESMMSTFMANASQTAAGGRWHITEIPLA